MRTSFARITTCLAVIVMMGIWHPAVAQTPSPAGGASFTITPHHAAISVPNLEESVAWYQRMLGFEVVRMPAALRRPSRPREPRW